MSGDCRDAVRDNLFEDECAARDRAARLAAERERFEAWAAKQSRAVLSDDGIGYLPSGFHEPSAWAGWLAALGLDP